MAEQMEAIRDAHRRGRDGDAALAADFGSLPHPFEGDYGADDAGATLFQWLYARMAAVHAGGNV